MNKAFVISCKESNYVIDCVKSIREHHRYSSIFIVDSCSNDKSYFSEVSQYGAIVLDASNKNYEYGAYLYWHKLYGNNYDSYIFMQDSIVLNQPIVEIDNVTDDNVMVFSQNRTGWDTGLMHRDYWYNLNPNFPVNDGKSMLMTIWNSFIITKNTFNKIVQSDIFNMSIPPHNKILSCAWERVWSIIFYENQISISSIKDGQITKIFGNRQ